MADNPRIEELRRRVENDPASIAFAQLAEEFRRAGDYEEAARVCRAGLAKHPSYLSARVTLGRSLIELQQFDEAQVELECVLRSAPENLVAVRGLAEIHQRRGNLTEALRHYQIALSLAKHDPELEESVLDLNRRLGADAARSDGIFGGSRNPSDGESAPSRPDVSRITAADSDAARMAAPSGGAEKPFAPTPLLSPELEAAADEFTKALQALDALTLNLPGAAQPEAAASAADATGAADAAASQDEAVAHELESWLEAIVRDREARAARS